MAEEWRLVRYDSSLKSVWDEFVRNARNATFLFERDYMDYHADRFHDCSWLAYKGGALRALLPANLDYEGVLHSHGGLSYGGWILPPAHFDAASMLRVFEVAISEWKSIGISKLDYKPLPAIYAARPSQEDLYALFHMGATLSEVNVSSTIDLRNPGNFNKLQNRHLAKASELPIEMVETDCVEEVMDILDKCLHERHDTRPVHSAAEMRLLMARFPENIRWFVTRLEGRIEAAVCIYDTGRVAHAQYIATTPEGRRLNLLTPLFNWLINCRYAERDYFDFGISNEDHGRFLNEGLHRQKSSYGATTTAFTRYTLLINSLN